MTATRTKPKNKRIHTTPCNQIDNISEIKKSLHDLDVIIRGNGDGKGGMRTDVALMCQRTESVVEFIDDLKTKFSLVSEVNTEIEIKNRVDKEVERLMEKAKQETEQKSNTKKINWKQTIAIILTGMMLLTSIVLGVLNYSMNSKKAGNESTAQSK